MQSQVCQPVLKGVVLESCIGPTILASHDAAGEEPHAKNAEDLDAILSSSSLPLCALSFRPKLFFTSPYIERCEYGQLFLSSPRSCAATFGNAARCAAFFACEVERYGQLRSQLTISDNPAAHFSRQLNQDVEKNVNQDINIRDNIIFLENMT